MAKVAAKDLREKTDQELQAQIAMEKKRLFEATVRGASGEALKPHEKRDGRRLIARIETILRERALRKELDARIAALEGKAQGAAPKLARLAAGSPNPQRSALRVRTVARALGQDLGPADRAAVALAEAKRRRTGVERTDVGQAR